MRLADKNQYVRVDPDLFVCLNLEDFKFETIFVRQKIRLPRDHHSPRLFAIDVSYPDPIFPDQQIALASQDESLVFNPNAAKNVYELCSLNGSDEISKDLLIYIKSPDQSAYEYGKYALSKRWVGAVKVGMKWNSRTGTYSFQAIYNSGGIMGRDPELVSHVEWDYTEQRELFTEKESNRKSLKIPMLGLVRSSFELGVNTYTILRDDRSVIVVEIWNVSGNLLY